MVLPTMGWVSPTSVNVIKTIPYRHAQKLTQHKQFLSGTLSLSSQVILDCVKLTKLAITQPVLFMTPPPENQAVPQYLPASLLPSFLLLGPKGSCGLVGVLET